MTLELQRAILPLHDEPFDAPGLRIAMRYLPASRDSRVGGDWYITAEMPTGQVLVAIGDVGGHGLTAAAGMARLRGALAGLAITGSPPDQLVGWLNDLVHHGRARAHRVGDRRLFRPGDPDADLGSGRASPARARPRARRPAARPAGRDPAGRRQGEVRAHQRGSCSPATCCCCTATG